MRNEKFDRDETNIGRSIRKSSKYYEDKRDDRNNNNTENDLRNVLNNLKGNKSTDVVMTTKLLNQGIY